MRGEKTADRRNLGVLHAPIQRAALVCNAERLVQQLPSVLAWFGYASKSHSFSLTKKIHVRVFVRSHTAAFLRWPSKPSHRERGTKKPGEHNVPGAYTLFPCTAKPSVTGWPFARSPAPSSRATAVVKKSKGTHQFVFLFLLLLLLLSLFFFLRKKTFSQVAEEPALCSYSLFFALRPASRRVPRQAKASMIHLVVAKRWQPICIPADTKLQRRDRRGTKLFFHKKKRTQLSTLAWFAQSDKNGPKIHSCSFRLSWGQKKKVTRILGRERWGGEILKPFQSRLVSLHSTPCGRLVVHPTPDDLFVERKFVNKSQRNRTRPPEGFTSAR